MLIAQIALVRSSRWLKLVTAGAAVMLGVLVFGSNAASIVSAQSVQASSALPVVALPGYTVSLFARGTSAYSHPDAIAVSPTHVFVAYQNVTAKDGTDHKSSTVVEYSKDGHVLRTFDIMGHCDGMKIDPVTHALWMTVNEDGNPLLYTYETSTATLKTYTFPPTIHGGGYDDFVFQNSVAFLAASNPTLNASGVNTFPAIQQVRLLNGGLQLTPVLSGTATATDITTNSTVTLNEIDPDSMTIDPAGDVVLVNQGGSEVVFVHATGTPGQTVKRLLVGTQLEDPTWVTAQEGLLYVVDGGLNAIFTLSTDFAPGTVYTEAPSDSGVAGFVGTLDLKTGTVTPIAVGFKSPTGLLFSPGDDEH